MAHRIKFLSAHTASIYPSDRSKSHIVSYRKVGDYIMVDSYGKGEVTYTIREWLSECEVRVTPLTVKVGHDRV